MSHKFDAAKFRISKFPGIDKLFITSDICFDLPTRSSASPKASGSTKYPQPGPNTSDDLNLRSFCFILKFASIAINCAYKNLREASDLRSGYYDENTYGSFNASVFQSSGRFFPGNGQAGHSTATSPSFVASIPALSCPRPALFSISKCLYRRRT